MADAAATKKRSTKAGGVRFSEKAPVSGAQGGGAQGSAARAAATQPPGAPSHVHFDDKLHDSVIMVTAEDDGSFLVKLGFLKAQHRYEIAFTLPEVPALGKEVCLAPRPSPHLRVIDVSPAPEGGLKMMCEYMAQQEGVLCEQVQLLSEANDDVCITVKVHARVMDRHHGTPMLLEGIRCIGVELEYDSEQSDWQGFD
ncbi:adipose-secreted signaling protein [Syngnathus typhle]|uniref:adipose-secreted signaling protein n=1 Tax=Syngnathus typhle TaxID=161592 RepID=UPI002A69D2D3|nr:adipose-secreted signaling protein [Syngnathus typhle]